VKPARLTVLLMSLAVLWGSAPVVAQDDPASELQQVQLELADITRAIKAARNEASAVGQQVAAAQANLDSALSLFNMAQTRVDETIARVHETEQAVAALTTQLSGLEADLARTEIDLRVTETRLEQQAVAMYMEASAMPAIELFTQRDAVAAATVIVYAGDIFAQNEETFTAFELLQREVERQRETVSGRRAEAQDQLAKLESEKAQLEIERNEANEALAAAQREAAAVQSLLDEIRQDIAAAEEHKDGLEADAARLEEEIARLQSQEGEAPGVIGWPINGRVSSPFGYRTHPILGVRRLHTGIDINGSTGTPISAAADGKVILSQTYGGYGRAVVIDHGGGMATLYAHQSSIAVSVGEVVTRGEVIGYVGCTGSCTGPHLHFEVRLNGVPVDPMQYLG
jgi:murein DD-endopeptidase MepM/ murein hydrolase activator NlpD